jgi:hypothetical protein
MEYIALVHKNTDSLPTAEEWRCFFDAANETGMFRGGSEIGSRRAVGSKEVSDTTLNIGGYMRFDSEDVNPVLELLNKHPVIRHGGTIELCEMPKS